MCTAHAQQTANALQESMATKMLQAICNSNRTDFMRYAAEHSMKPSCHMGGEHSLQSLGSSTPANAPPGMLLIATNV